MNEERNRDGVRRRGMGRDKKLPVGDILDSRRGTEGSETLHEMDFRPRNVVPLNKAEYV